MTNTYMGNPCKRGHNGTRYSNGTCVQCSIDRATKRNKTPEARAWAASYARRPETKTREAVRRSQPGAKLKKAVLRRRLAYDMLPTEWSFMLAGQQYRCAICGAAEPGGRYGSWHTDHCHGTNKVRGILCHSCNLGLGQFKDSPERLQAAIGYLCQTNQTSTPPPLATAGQSNHWPNIAQVATLFIPLSAGT